MSLFCTVEIYLCLSAFLYFLLLYSLPTFCYFIWDQFLLPKRLFSIPFSTGLLGKGCILIWNKLYFVIHFKEYFWGIWNSMWQIFSFHTLIYLILFLLSSFMARSHCHIVTLNLPFILWQIWVFCSLLFSNDVIICSFLCIYLA